MIYAITALFAFQLLGEILVQTLSLPLPGPLAGMLLLTAALLIRGGVPSSLESTASVMLQNLMLLFIPGINILAFFLVNGYLLGREFFEFAAMRFRSEQEAKDLRRRNAGTVFMAGLVIAAFLAVPILNLLTPLFAAAMMVHLHKSVSAAERRPAMARA